MAVAFRSVSTRGTDFSATGTGDAPTGTAENDILIACVGITEFADPTGPSGWTKIDSETSIQSNLNDNTIWWKRAGGSEPSTYDWTAASGTPRWVIRISAWTGAGTVGDPFNATAFTTDTSTGAGDPYNATGVTTTVADCGIIFIINADNLGSDNILDTWSATDPAVFTEHLDDESDPVGAFQTQVGIAFAVQTSIGATGTCHVTASVGGGLGEARLAVLALSPLSVVTKDSGSPYYVSVYNSITERAAYTTVVPANIDPSGAYAVLDTPLSTLGSVYTVVTQIVQSLAAEYEVLYTTQNSLPSGYRVSVDAASALSNKYAILVVLNAAQAAAYQVDPSAFFTLDGSDTEVVVSESRISIAPLGSQDLFLKGPNSLFIEAVGITYQLPSDVIAHFRGNNYTIIWSFKGVGGVFLYRQDL